MNIRDMIKEIVRTEFIENYGVPCLVKSVDTGDNTCVCSPLNGDADFIGVRLQAHPGNGVLIIPAVDSRVIVQPINEVTGFIAMFSQVESIQFLDGSYGGLIKIADLVEKLNAVEEQTNDLLSTLQGIIIPLAPSGTYPFAPEFASITPLVPTEQAEIENDKITHGDN